MLRRDHELRLILTTLLVIIFEKRYFAPLLRPVNTIADVAMLMVSSKRYLELARERGATGLRSDQYFRSRLGWFRTRLDDVRWGIELANENVEFLTEEEVRCHDRFTTIKTNQTNLIT